MSILALTCCDHEVIDMADGHGHNLASSVSLKPETRLCGDFGPSQSLKISPDPCPPSTRGVDQTVNCLKEFDALMVFEFEGGLQFRNRFGKDTSILFTLISLEKSCTDIST